MPKRPPFNLAGTVPGEHGLEGIAAQLRQRPRDRVYAVVEFYNSNTGKATPIDAPDEPYITITLLTLDPVVVPDDVNTLQEIVKRARGTRPGQVEMDYPAGTGEDELAARRTGEQP